MRAATPPIPVIEHDSVASTNDEALALARRGECGPLWVVASRQTAGRGRSGRSWQSPPGNLHASLLLPVGAPAANVPQLALVAGVGLFDAVAAAVGESPLADLRLKWPNDILVGTAKLGGILVESSRNGAAAAAAIGIGVNVTTAPAVPGRVVTSLASLGVRVARDRLLEELSRGLLGWIARWGDGRGFAEVRSAWVARAGAIGEPIVVRSATGEIAGLYRGLDEDGALLVEAEEGRTIKVSHGDVELGGGREFC